LVGEAGAQHIVRQATLRQGHRRRDGRLGFDRINPGDLLQLHMRRGIALLTVQGSSEHSAGGDGGTEDGEEGCVHGAILC
jgi:hypothetical protein